jgi:hypothetical protein
MHHGVVRGQLVLLAGRRDYGGAPPIGIGPSTLSGCATPWKSTPPSEKVQSGRPRGPNVIPRQSRRITDVNNSLRQWSELHESFAPERFKGPTLTYVSSCQAVEGYVIVDPWNVQDGWMAPA